MLLLLLSHFSRVWLCAVPWMAAHQAPSSLGFSRQEQWSGLPFPSTMHESEKWKWSRSVVSDSSRPHGLQPTRLLHSWDFPGKSTGVGCHCLLRNCHEFFVSYEVPYTGTSYMPSHHWHHLSYVTWVIAFQKLLIVTCEWITHWRVVVFVVARSLRCLWFFATPWTVPHQAPPSMGFSRQEYWSGLPWPSPGDLPNSGIEPWSPALQADALPFEPPGKPQ